MAIVVNVIQQNNMYTFDVKKFEELSLTELYRILQLRQEVFIVEQNCPYLDADGKDLKSIHISLYNNQKLVGYCRILPAGVSYSMASIGRVITPADCRGKGYGKAIVQKAIEEIEQHYHTTAIQIGAQAYLKRFYESFGFEDLNQPYLEDGIPHLLMLRK